MKKKFSIPVVFFLLIPTIAFAQVITDFRSLMQLFANLLGGMMGILYMLAFAAFFWGIALFVLNTDDDKKRQEGKTWMLWAVIALFVMIALWGIVKILTNTVGFRFAIPHL